MLRASSYSTVLGLSYQSYQFNTQMNTQIVKMTKHALESTQATTLAETDVVLSEENIEKSAANELKSVEQKEEAMAEEAKADSLFALAEKDFTTAAELAGQAAEEQSSAEVHEVNAAAEEALFESSSEKAVAEAAESAEYEGEAEADELATGLCSFIPGLDVLCGVVGGMSSVALQSAAAKWMAESIVDGAEATAEKFKEEQDQAAAVELEAKAAEDEASSATIHSQAQEEELSAEQHEATAKEEEAESTLLSEQSKSEELLAEQEEEEATAEETKASEEMEQSTQHGIYAMWNALGSSIMAGLSFLFFAIRIYVAVLLPALGLLFEFPSIVSTAFGATTTTTTTTTINGVTATRNLTTIQRVHQILPLHSTSYTLLHMGIFYQSILFFSSKFDSFVTLNMISRGGIIIAFAILGAALQAFLLHAFKHIIKDYYKSTKENEESVDCSTTDKDELDDTISTTSTTSTSSTITMDTVSSPVTPSVISFFQSTCHYTWTFLRAFVYLTPLFIIETLIIWLLFGTSTFLFSSTAAGTSEVVSSGNFLSNMITPWSWACFLGLVVMFHFWAFELKDDASNSDVATPIENDINDNEDKSLDVSYETVSSSSSSSSTSASSSDNGLEQEQQSLLDSIDRNTMSSSTYGGLNNTNESSSNNPSIPSNTHTETRKARHGMINTNVSSCLSPNSTYSTSALGTTLSNMGVTSASYRNIFTGTEKRAALAAASVVSSATTTASTTTRTGSGGHGGKNQFLKDEPMDNDWSNYMRYLSLSKSNSHKTTTKKRKEKMEMKEPSPILQTTTQATTQTTTAQFQTNPIQKYILTPLYNYLLDIQLPFEILLLVSIYLLLQNTTPVFSKLWPTFYNLVVESIPLYYWSIIGGSILLVGFVWWKVCGSGGEDKGDERRRRRPHLGVLTGDTLRTLEIQV